MTWLLIDAEGNAPSVARDLLSLAETPYHVRSVENGTAFEVPPYLAAAYWEMRDVVSPTPEPDPVPAPVKRRGRARKEA